MTFIIDMQSADQIPSVAEPLFQDLGARVEFHPVMLLDDLKKAIQVQLVDASIVELYLRSKS